MTNLAPFGTIASMFIFVLRLHLLLLALYTAFRLLFWGFNRDLFANVGVADILLAAVIGVRFDLSIIVVTTVVVSLMALWLKAKKAQQLLWYLAFFVQLPLMVLNIGDIGFIRFSGRRMTWDQWAVVREAQGKWGAIWESHGYLILSGLGLLLLFSYLVLRAAPKRALEIPGSKLRTQALATLGLLLAAVLAVRGGLQSKPISFISAQVFVAQPQLNLLVLNSSFTFLHSLRKRSYPRERGMEPAQTLAILAADRESRPSLGLLPPQKTNVVLLVLESFSREHMPTYTPFLAQLEQQSLSLPRAYGNGRRSIEGIAALLAGVPGVMDEPFIASPFSQSGVMGLPQFLPNHEFYFFHGGKNGTMHFDRFTKSLGFQHYVGKDEYSDPGHDDGTWGIWDHHFLKFMHQQLATQKQQRSETPFFAVFFSLSSHHPFKVPPELSAQFPDSLGTHPLHKTVRYTDWAVGEFFKQLEQEPWFKDTLFIVTADHGFEPLQPFNQTPWGVYPIPLFFYHPQVRQWPAIDVSQPVSQIDVIPTLVDIFGLKGSPKNLLASSVFAPGPKQVVNQFAGQWFLLATEKVAIGQERGSAMTWALFSLDGNRQESGLTEGEVQRFQAWRQYFNDSVWELGFFRSQ